MSPDRAPEPEREEDRHGGQSLSTGNEPKTTNAPSEDENAESRRDEPEEPNTDTIDLTDDDHEIEEVKHTPTRQDSLENACKIFDAISTIDLAPTSPVMISEVTMTSWQQAYVTSEPSSAVPSPAVPRTTNPVPTASAITCSHCDNHSQRFATIEELKRHKRVKHKIIEHGDAFWACSAPKCWANAGMFTTTGTLKAHVLRRHKPKDHWTDFLKKETFCNNKHSKLAAKLRHQTERKDRLRREAAKKKHSDPAQSHTLAASQVADPGYASLRPDFSFLDKPVAPPADSSMSDFEKWLYDDNPPKPSSNLGIVPQSNSTQSLQPSAAPENHPVQSNPQYNAQMILARQKAQMQAQIQAQTRPQVQAQMQTLMRIQMQQASAAQARQQPYGLQQQHPGITSAPSVNSMSAPSSTLTTAQVQAQLRAQQLQRMMALQRLAQANSQKQSVANMPLNSVAAPLAGIQGALSSLQNKIGNGYGDMRVSGGSLIQGNVTINIYNRQETASAPHATTTAGSYMYNINSGYG